jgi:hypothetical protein
MANNVVVTQASPDELYSKHISKLRNEYVIDARLLEKRNKFVSTSMALKKLARAGFSLNSRKVADSISIRTNKYE